MAKCKVQVRRKEGARTALQGFRDTFFCKTNLISAFHQFHLLLQSTYFFSSKYRKYGAPISETIMPAGMPAG